MAQDNPFARFAQPAAPLRPLPSPPKKVDPYREANEARAVEDQQMQRDRFEYERQQRAVETAAKNRESEAKAAAFLLRGLGANEGYERTGVGPRSLPGQILADTAPNILNTLPSWMGNSDERQVADTTQDEFIAASLRQDSGAAIPEEEMERQRRIYFPMPGDREDVIEGKKMARARALEGLRQSAGPLAKPTEERYRSMPQNSPEIVYDRVMAENRAGFYALWAKNHGDLNAPNRSGKTADQVWDEVYQNGLVNLRNNPAYQREVSGKKPAVRRQTAAPKWGTAKVVE